MELTPEEFDKQLAKEYKEWANYFSGSKFKGKQ